MFLIAQNLSDTFLFCIFLYRNEVIILQPFQNQAFRVGSENDKNDFIQKDEFRKNCFVLYFFSGKLSHYKTYDFKKLLISDAFKHVRLQNTFHWCKVHQIFTSNGWLCLLFGERHKLSERNVYTENLFLARFFQECHCIQKSCKNWIFSKNLARFS